MTIQNDSSPKRVPHKKDPQKLTLDEMKEGAKRHMLAYMPESIEHVLNCTSFDESTTPEEMAIAHHCICIGLLHGLFSGLSQVLDIEDGSDLPRKLEAIDMVRDEVASALRAITNDIRERAIKRDGK